MRHLLVTLLLSIGSVAVAAETTSIALTVSPAAAPRPALQYPLLPPMADLRPGNAILSYYRAMSPEWTRILFTPEAVRKTEAWESLRPRELPLDEVRAYLQTGVKYPLRELDIGARRRRCEWDLEDQAAQEAFTLLLPELQGLRSLARLLKLRGKLELAEGQFDAALKTIQTGYAMGRHIGEGPTLIHALVGMSIIQQFTGLVEEWIATPHAPNLYWGLTTLPQPMVDMTHAIGGELRILRQYLPPLDRLQERNFTEAEVNQILTEMIDKIAKLSSDNLTATLKTRAALATAVIMAFPNAKKELEQRGFPPERLRDMPQVQVVLLSGGLVMNEMIDDMTKWMGLPFVDGIGPLKEEEKRLKQRMHEQHVGVGERLYALVMPSYAAVYQNQHRAQRRLVMLRVVEALRMYSAANDGKWPESLDEVKQVPLPLDPGTGKAFQYRRKEALATLTAPGWPGEPENSRSPAVTYELTITP